MKKLLCLFLVFTLMASLCSFSFVTAEEYVIKESFESGMGNFTFASSKNTEKDVFGASDAASDGLKSIHVIDASDDSAAGVASPRVEISANTEYTMLVDMFAVKTKTVKAYLRYTDSAKKTLVNKSVAISKEGVWETMSLTEAAPADAAYAQIFIMSAGKGSAEAYIDNVRLVKGSFKAPAITNAINPEIVVSSEPEETVKQSTKAFPDWTKIEEINFGLTEKKESSNQADGLTGSKVYFTNMAYGRSEMRAFNVMNGGTAANGNDFSKYPQKAEVVEVGGEKAIYIDSPASGSSMTLYIPLIVFDDVYTNGLNYKFKFKAKRGNGEVLGSDNCNFYVRQLTESGARNGNAQTQAYFIEKTTDWKEYEVLVTSTSIIEGTGSLTGLLNAGSKEGFRDLYIKDIEVYVKDNSKPMLLFDAPDFKPEKGVHPRVYFNSGDIEKIKTNATHPENKVAYDLLLKEVAVEETGIMKESTGDNLSEKTMGIIQSKALYYAVWGDEKAGKDAVNALINLLNTGNYSKSEYNTQGLLVFTIGAVYDWCFPLLTEENKVFFQNKGVDVASVMEIGYPPAIGSTVYGHSAEAQLMRDQMALALAVSDEREDIYINVAGRFFSEFKEGREFLYKAHSLPFGTCYTTYRFQWDMLSTYMMKALGFKDYYGPDQQKALYWLLYARRPDGSLLRDGDTKVNGRGIGSYDTTGTRAFWLAGNYWKDPYLKGEALRRSKAGLAPTALSGNQTIGAVEFLLFNDPSVGYKTTRELPLSMYYPAPKGGMIARTGWAEGNNSPAVVAEMEIDEWWFQGHQHLDAGSFQIYYKGALANDTGYYQAGRDGDKNKNEGNTVYGTMHFHNYQRRTIAHNCMVVYDPDEPVVNYNGHVNDGGQISHNGEKLQLSMKGFFENENEYHIAKVLGQEIGTDTVQPDYTYLKGDLEKAYGEKVSGYERSFMFLNLKNNETPAAMIVFDRVESQKETFDKKWIMHGLNEPEISGSRTVFKDTREGYNGKLTIDTLLPKSDNLSINKVGGEGQEYLVDGVNYWAQTLKGAYNEGGGYRIEVSPKADAKEDYFLNVLQVADADSKAEPLSSEMIESATHTGVKVADRVVMFGKLKDRVSNDVTFTVNGEGWFKYTVCDLKEGTWKVVKDGADLCEIVATKDGGIGSFETTAGVIFLTYLGAYGEKTFTTTPLVTEGINIKVNSKYIYCDVEPTLINSRTMVPLRAIFEALKANVSWDEATATATGVSSDGEITVKITENSSTGYVNGKEVYLDSPAVIKNGRFLVPVRFISESLGALVSWDDYSQTVYIMMSSATQSTGNFENAASIRSVKQSGDNGAGDSIENSVDGDVASGWSSQGIGEEDAWGIYELSEEAEIKELAISYNKGNERMYKFSVAVSSDGVNYTEVLTDAVSSGETSDYETFKITKPTKAKYIKYIGKGSNVNAWNNIYEIVFLK